MSSSPTAQTINGAWTAAGPIVAVWIPVLVIVLSIVFYAAKSLVLQKNIDFEARRQFFPLDFSLATRYRIIPEESSGLTVFKVIDQTGFIRYRFQWQRRRWWARLISEPWILKDHMGKEIAMVIRRLPLLDIWSSQVIFYLRSQLDVELSNMMDHGHTAISATSSEMSPVGSPLFPPTMPYNNGVPVTLPYMDMGICLNDHVSKDELGPSREMPMPRELLTAERRHLPRIRAKHIHKWCQTSFRINMDDKHIRYTWRANGYLEKASKFETDPTSVRVALVQVGGVLSKPTEFILYNNSAMLEDLTVLCTAFVSFRAQYWHRKRTTFN